MAFLLAWGLNSLALIPWRRSAGKHWTERARLLYPARVSGALNILLIPINLVLALMNLEPGMPGYWLLFGIAGWFGAVLGNFPSAHEVFPQLHFRRWLHQFVFAWMIRLGIWLVYLSCAVAMPKNFGWPTILIAGAALLIHLSGIWGFRMRLFRCTGFVKPADGRLLRIVTETTLRMSVSVRGVWILAGTYAQAYALPATRELLFSERLLQICDDGEISSICAHELGHLTEPKTVLFRRIIGSFALFPLIFFKPVVAATGQIAPLLLLIPIWLFLVVRGLSMRMEKRADQVAVENQIESGVYGRALEKLYRENLVPAVNASNRRAHPHLYDRLLAAGVTPDYPKPLPPRGQSWTSRLMFAFLFIIPAISIATDAIRDVWNGFVFNHN